MEKPLAFTDIRSSSGIFYLNTGREAQVALMNFPSGLLSRAKPRHRVGELSPRKQKQLVWYAKIDKAHPPALSLGVVTAVVAVDLPRKFVQRKRVREFIRILRSLSRTFRVVVTSRLIMRGCTVAAFLFSRKGTEEREE